MVVAAGDEAALRERCEELLRGNNLSRTGSDARFSDRLPDLRAIPSSEKARVAGGEPPAHGKTGRRA